MALMIMGRNRALPSPYDHDDTKDRKASMVLSNLVDHDQIHILTDI